MRRRGKIAAIFYLGAAMLASVSAAAWMPEWDGRAETKGNLPGEENWVWRYLDDPQAILQLEGTDWTGMDFDDTGWMVGSGAFGANDGRREEVTKGYEPDVCLRQYLPDGDNLPVYCFRAEFTVDPLELPAGQEEIFDIEIAYDDAAVLYLNGEPLFDANAPSAGYESLWEYGCEEILVEPEEASFTLNAGMLREGINVLAVELHQANKSSSDIYFHLKSFTSPESKAAVIRNRTVCLGVGGAEDELLVTWQGTGEEGYVEVAEAAQAPAEGFPENVRIWPAEAVCENDWDTVTFRSELTGLTPGGKYLYRVVDSAASDVYSFTVPVEGDFSFLVNGDPQIADEREAHPMNNYELLAETAMGGESPAFLLSLGDQSDRRDNEKLFMRYTDTKLVKEFPLAAVVGNHEDASEVFSSFFFLPNMDEESIASSGDMSGDYWFFRDHTLFLCLNSNNGDFEEHEEFLRGAVETYREQYGEPAWTVAAFHHSLFSAGEHSASEDILERRENYVPVLEELGVDIVFMGHDHTYVRTCPMDGLTPLPDPAAEIRDTDAIVYVTLNSSTGTKYYDLSGEYSEYSAVALQNYCPSLARVDVTDTDFTVTVFYKREDGTVEVLDAFRLLKE